MRFSRRSNNVAIAAFTLCLALGMATILVVWYDVASRSDQATRTDTPTAPDERYTGRIVLPGDGLCRRMEFDNATGSVRPVGPGSCEDDAPALNSTQGRIDAIRGAFQKR